MDGDLLSRFVGVPHFGLLLGLTLFAIAALLWAVPWAVAQMHRTGTQHDPQLSVKTILHGMASLGFLTLLSGVSLVLTDALTQFERVAVGVDFPSDTLRDGAALIIAGALFTAVPWIILRVSTTDRILFAGRRVYCSWRLFLHTLVIVLCGIVIATLLLEKEPAGLEAKKALRRQELTAYAFLLVWSVSWVGHLGMLWWLGSKPDVPASSLTWDPETPEEEEA